MHGSELVAGQSESRIGLFRPLRRQFTNGRSYVLALLGALSVALLIAIAVMSSAFVYGRVPGWDDTLLFVSALSAAGLLYSIAAVFLPDGRSSRRLLATVVALGFIARACFFGSTPVYEDDWHRYLWDGAVVSAGVNPYAASPAQGLLTDLNGNAVSPSEDATIAQLQSIGADHPHFPERVNYPYVTTIYPPVALAAFAMAHQISPFSLDSFRLILLLSDCLALVLLMLLLGRYNRSPFWAVLYWLNPVVIVTVFNAGHMDALLAPLLLATLILVEYRRPKFAAVALAAAAGVKLWPIVLAPIVFRAWRDDMKEIFATGLIFTAMVALFVGPLILSLQSQNSGLGAYASEWIVNSFLFTYMSSGLSIFFEDGGRYLRLASAGLVGAAAFWFALSRRGIATPLPTAMMLTTLLLFAVSPTGYPWYALWFMVFAPFATMVGVVLFAATLPVYYLRFLMSENGWDALFNFGLTPIEFGLPIALVCYELYKRPPWRV